MEKRLNIVDPLTANSKQRIFSLRVQQDWDLSDLQRALRTDRFPGQPLVNIKVLILSQYLDTPHTPDPSKLVTDSASPTYDGISLAEFAPLENIVDRFPTVKQRDKKIHMIVYLDEQFSPIMASSGNIKKDVNLDLRNADDQRATKKMKFDHIEKSDSAPNWLLNWHSTLWGMAHERPFTRTVVVNVASYKDLQERLVGVPLEEAIKVKRSFLNSLPDDAANTIEMDAEMGIDADLTLPMRISYLDLSDLKLSRRMPQLIFYRPEFDELTRAIDDHPRLNEAHYHFVTGTPGIGKTVYLHLRIIQMLLEGKPILYQTWNGKVFHFGETVTEIVEDELPEYLASPSHIFVDFDGVSGAHITAPAVPIQNLTQGTIILASSPGPTIHSSWKEQMQNETWVLRNWKSEEFWAAHIFFSPNLINADQLRNIVLHLGFNPRSCNRAITPVNFDKDIDAIKEAVDSIKNVEQLVTYLHRDRSPDWKATHRIFEVAPGDSLLYSKAYLRPRSDWVLDMITDSLEEKHHIEQSQFHDLIASHTDGSGFFGLFWERRVHNFFWGSRNKSRTFTLKEIGTTDEIVWKPDIQHAEYFASTGLSSKLEPIVAGATMSYLQPLSHSYPTIDSMIYSKEPIVQGVRPLVLLQIATNVHPLKVVGFQLLQRHLSPSLPFVKNLRPQKNNPWAVVFVVPEDKVGVFIHMQTLEGDATDVGIWKSKTRQFVLGLAREDVYGLKSTRYISMLRV